MSDEEIIAYLKELYSYMGNSSELVALYAENYEPVYSNINDIGELDIKPILKNEMNQYYLRNIGSHNYMLFPSCWDINSKTIYIINAYDICSIYEEKDRQMSVILITDIIILIVSSIAVFIFSKYLTNPISRLNKTSKKIAFGKFNERINIKNKDEIGELAESFNIMAKEIENKINELNLQVKQKNDFINGFTHELKTPMTAIMGYSDLLRLKKCDEEVSKKALNYIYFETKRLESLSFKLMKLMSLTEEKIEKTDIDISELMNKILKIENEINSEIKIKLEIEPSVIKGDIELLEVVMRNLIENAKKAEPKDNVVIIKGEKIQNCKYRIYVIDKGKGIPKEEIERVTEDFYMVDKARSRKTGGSGIGLSLVKKILNFHKTDIFIESEEGIGTTVYFDLEETKGEEDSNYEN